MKPLLVLMMLAPACLSAATIYTTAEAHGFISTTHDPTGISQTCGPDSGTTSAFCEVSAQIPADEVNGSFRAYGMATASYFSLLADAYVDVAAHTYAEEPPPEVNSVVFNTASSRSSAQMEDHLLFAGAGQGTIRYSIEAWWTAAGTAQFWHDSVSAPLVQGGTVEFVQTFIFDVPFTIRASVRAEAFAEIFGTSDEWAGLNFQILEVSEPVQTTAEAPEPSTWALILGGIVAFPLLRRVTARGLALEQEETSRSPAVRAH